MNIFSKNKDLKFLKYINKKAYNIYGIKPFLILILPFEIKRYAIDVKILKISIKFMDRKVY